MTDLPTLHTAGLTLDAQLNLLDRQLLDIRQVPIGVVADLEIAGLELDASIAPGSPPPRIASLVAGSGLWTRLFGGRPPESRLHHVPWSIVAAVHTAIDVGVSGERLDVAWPERWVRDHVIGRIPGGKHAPE